MKKPICKKGVECSAWRSDLFHSVVFMHGPEEPIGRETEGGEGPSREATGSPLTKKKRLLGPRENLDDIRNFLEQKYLVSFPADFLRFWKNLKQFQNAKDDLCGVLQPLDSLKLVGPFKILTERIDKKDLEYDEDHYLTSDRYATDLPEMQTLAVYDGGRYAYWRDTPNQKDVFLVHVKHDDAHFPKMEIIGDADPRWIIVHIVGNKPSKNFSSADNKLWPSLYKIYAQEAKKLVRERKQLAYGQPFHGLGLFIEVKGDVGFRPLDNPTPADLKTLLKRISATEDAGEKSKLKEQLMDITTYVDIANDEMDYSLGLEVGHDLFWSNFPDFDRFTEITLSNSYSLLKRDAFAKILQTHLKVRRTDLELNH